ncbi:MAG: hypothetical protein L6Q71_11775 [Planctomycetes bacterium]|nr:hypothetical protein [Planctomycetota bacterium]NUQ34450.1 hypothetical protein [Planctomycetaceae bacterium]
MPASSQQQILAAANTPCEIVDYKGDTRAIPGSYTPVKPEAKDLAEIHKLMFTRKLVDPTNDHEFDAHEIRDIFRFGRAPINLGVSVPKTKKVGQYDLAGDLMTPIISPSSLFTGCDYQEWRPSLHFFIITPNNKDEKPRLPKYLKKWHKEDLPILKQKFGNARQYLASRVPMEITADFNTFKHNRHPLLVQGTHRLAACAWQIMQQFEHNEGFKQVELDAWTYVAYIEIAYSGPLWGFQMDYDLIRFVAERIKNVTNVDEFGPKGYQDYMLRYVFLAYYLGQADAGWDAACGISKLRGTEFTKSLLYDYILELKEEPQKFADMFKENPRELLNYFKM